MIGLTYAYCVTTSADIHIGWFSSWNWWRPLAGLSSRYLSRPLSLAISPWVGGTSTGDGFGNLWEEMVPLKLRPYGAL